MVEYDFRAIRTRLLHPRLLVVDVLRRRSVRWQWCSDLRLRHLWWRNSPRATVTVAVGSCSEQMLERSPTAGSAGCLAAQFVTSSRCSYRARPGGVLHDPPAADRILSAVVANLELDGANASSSCRVIVSPWVAEKRCWHPPHGSTRCRSGFEQADPGIGTHGGCPHQAVRPSSGDDATRTPLGLANGRAVLRPWVERSTLRRG